MTDARRPGRRRLATRLLTWYAVTFLALILVAGFLITSEMRDALTARTVESLEGKARLISYALDSDRPLQPQVEHLARESETRLTLVAPDGTVLADSAFDPLAMENHRNRPEVEAALQDQLGTDRRVSDTTGVAQLYVALSLDPANLVVRVSVTEAQISADLRVIQSRIAWIAALIGAAGVALVAVVANRVTRPISRLTEVASRVADGELTLRPDSSDVVELDGLSAAIGRMGSQLGARIMEGEAERRTLEVVLGALPQGVIHIEADDRVAYGNPAARVLIGPLSDRLGGIAPHGLQRLVRECRRGGGTRQTTLEHGVPSRLLQLTVSPFDDEDRRVLVVVEDVTEQRRMAQMRRDFVADASHELKTPVASILASVEALQLALQHDPDRAMGFVGQVEASARQLVRIVADLLDLSRLESSQPQAETVRLDRVAADEIDRLRERAEAAGIDLVFEGFPVEVLGSANDLGLAIRNLCDNALRYTDSGGSVRVSVAPSGADAVVEVADTGAGIPTRALDRVFERFFRVDEARSRATGGTGLGLAIVKHVAERHGGSVAVESELGRGSAFRMTIPRAGPGRW